MKWSNKLFRFALLLPVLWWIYQIFFGNLGAEPAKELNHQTGFMALIYLFANLAIGIYSSLFQWPPQLRFFMQERRWLGVITWVFLVGHIFFYLALEAFAAKGFSQIFEKTYLIFGFFAFLGMTILAATSNNFSVRKLTGKKWKLLHRGVYFVALLVMAHIFQIEKANLVLFAMITFPVWILLFIRFALYLKRKTA